MPLGDGNPELIHTMEEVMALLLFTDRKQAEESVWGKSLGLDDEGQRRDNIAHEINSAIMNHQEGLEPDDFDPSDGVEASHEDEGAAHKAEETF